MKYASDRQTDRQTYVADTLIIILRINIMRICIHATLESFQCSEWDSEWDQQEHISQSIEHRP